MAPASPASTSQSIREQTPRIPPLVLRKALHLSLSTLHPSLSTPARPPLPVHPSLSTPPSPPLPAHLSLSRSHAYAALVFNNCLNNGEPDERTLHEGQPVTRGAKYVVNGWVRAKSAASHVMEAEAALLKTRRLAASRRTTADTTAADEEHASRSRGSGKQGKQNQQDDRI